jgi:ribosomal protein L24E
MADRRQPMAVIPKQILPRPIMFQQVSRSSALLISMFVAVWIAGCGGSRAPETSKSANSGSKKSTPVASTTEESSDEPTATAPKEGTPSESFAPVKLGGGGGDTSSSATTATKKSVPPEKQLDDVKKALKPIQVVLGPWHAIIDKSKDYEDLQWVWDWKTDRAQPALAMATKEDGAYFKTMRLTYLVEEEKFQMTVADKEGNQRVLQGTFTAEPTDKPGDDKKQTPQRTFKLLLTETGDAKDRWQIVMNQQDNNRYLLELARLRGKNFVRFDTIGSQREGTSFALDDSDFKEKTCVISQGLGTMQVSHKGKSYWVCCSGCKAAFEEDPEKWIAKFEAMQGSK